MALPPTTASDIHPDGYDLGYTYDALFVFKGDTFVLKDPIRNIGLDPSERSHLMPGNGMIKCV